MLSTYSYGSDKLVLTIFILNYWILDYVFVGRYNTEGFFSGQYGGTDAESVLQSGTSVCSGYANLFEALCKLVFEFFAWILCERNSFCFWFPLATQDLMKNGLKNALEEMQSNYTYNLSAPQTFLFQ